jgi:hypothetical protein
MKNYTASQIVEFQAQYSQHFSHVIVAHTKLRPYSKTPAQIERMAADAKRSCRHALNCFYKLLYPGATNKPVRHPHLYRPLTFVTMEGAKETMDAAQTIHFNITLGCLPGKLTAEEVETLFRHAWVDMAGQGTNIKAEKYYGNDQQTWLTYTLKEAQHFSTKAWSTDGIWDVENCWIPHKILNAD